MSEAMADLCCSQNETVLQCRHLGDLTLDEFITRQAGKVLLNRCLTPLQDPGDFYSLASGFASERLGDKAGDGVLQAIKSGVISTADHHGALYCAQSFQGDLLFSLLIRKLQASGSYVPVFSGGQVELGNVTYARGFITYTSKEDKQTLPLFPVKQLNQMASKTPAFDREMLKRLRTRLPLTKTEPLAAKAVGEILDTLYDQADILQEKRFADQTTKLGFRLSQTLFKGEEEAPLLTYLELEEITLPLLIHDLTDKNSLIYRLLNHPEVPELMMKIRTPAGTPLSGLLFATSDKRGRKVFLTLTPDGVLVGRDWHGQAVRYPADIPNLVSLLKCHQIFPCLFTISLLLAFSRGITWMGGMFQSCYLPGWQQTLVMLLDEAHFSDEARLISAYDCSGYISGPMFALYPGEDFATPAGPIEFWIRRPEWSRLLELIRETSLWEAHRYGLAEMYPDLVSPERREDDWYRIIAEELSEMNAKGIL